MTARRRLAFVVVTTVLAGVLLLALVAAAFAAVPVAIALGDRRVRARGRAALPRPPVVAAAQPAGPLERCGAAADVDGPSWTTAWDAQPMPSDLPATRTQVTAVLTEWDVHGEAAEPTLLVVTELLTNAVEHARPPLRVTLRLGHEFVRVEVCDADARATTVPPAGGRGARPRRADRRGARAAARVDPGPGRQDGVGRRVRRLARVSRGPRSDPDGRGQPVASLPCLPPSSPGSASSSTPPSPPSGAPAGRARTRWPRPCARRSPPASTWPCRRAPAPASRWPTSCPAIHHAVEKDTTVVVSTATIALQRQLVDRDLPRARQGAQAAARPRPDVRDPQGPPQLPVPQQAARRRRDDPEDELFDPFQISAMGRAVKRIHEWADDTETGDRDELVPGVPDSTWRQVSVTARECLGAAQCPVGEDCFAETRPRGGRAGRHRRHQPRAAGHRRLEGRAVLPEHDVVVVDEAHELVDRVTGVATAELTAGAVAAAARRLGKLVDQAAADRLAEAGEGLGLVLEDLPPGRWEALPQPASGALSAVRDAAGAVPHGAGRRAPGGARGRGGPQDRAGRARRGDRHRRPAAQGVRRAGSGEALRRRVARRGGRRPAQGRCTPRRCGSAGCCGSGCSGAPPWCSPRPRWRSAATSTRWPGSGGCPRRAAPRRATTRCPIPEAPKWSGLDVGSPFAHARSGILYVAKSLPPPGPRRAAARLPRRDRRAGRGRGRPHARAVLLDARRQAGHRGAARPAGHPAALPGRRRHDAAGQAVRRGRGDVAVRHAVAVAGRRRARARRCRA